MANTYALISSQVLGSAQSSVTFSSIPSIYTDLVLRISARGDRAAVNTLVRIKFNSSTTGYSERQFNGDGTTVTGGNTTNQTIGLSGGAFEISAATATSSTFGNGEIYIPLYTASQNKQFGAFSVRENNTAAANMGSMADLWQDTTAISTIVLSCNIGNFDTGSSFYLYGIKNS